MFGYSLGYSTIPYLPSWCTFYICRNALVWLMSIRDPTGKLARWPIYLQQYDYDSVHRKGVKHSNVDTLSRPVLVIDVKSTSSSDTLPSFLSNVDPHEDEALLYYLQFGRHLAGQSKKKCKNVLQNSKHYNYADNKLWYRKDVTSANFLDIPKRLKRYDLIKHEHLLGHYQTPTVYDALKLTYFLPRMRDDIHYFIKKCVPCKRHQVEPTVNHSAQVIKPYRVFDRFGADLVFGLPETAEGYIGILIVKEYLTKYPHAFPIKSKCAD
jgi:hypothetical protein